MQGVGCPADEYFCAGNVFWHDNYWDGSAGRGYPVGAGSSVISPTGAAGGWRWSEFGAPQTPSPPTQAADRARSWLTAQQVLTSGGFGSVSASNWAAQRGTGQLNAEPFHSERCIPW